MEGLKCFQSHVLTSAEKRRAGGREKDEEGVCARERGLVLEIVVKCAISLLSGSAVVVVIGMFGTLAMQWTGSSRVSALASRNEYIQSAFHHGHTCGAAFCDEIEAMYTIILSAMWVFPQEEQETNVEFRVRRETDVVTHAHHCSC